MTKSIYKITNLLNNKCYIGQTNDIKRRFQQHRRMANDNDGTAKTLYAAMKKYGIENFSFEILEQDIENYDEREEYWINYYNSHEDGYNLTPGGSAPPILKGLNNPNTAHTSQQVELVKKLLEETELSAELIGNIINYDPTAILRINLGIMWREEGRHYPIRLTLSKQFNHDRALDIINDLLNTKMTQKEIANKYGVSRSTVTMINIGQNNHQPIREFVNATEAADFAKVSRSAIQLCCSGSTKSSGGYFWKYKDE